MEKNFKIILITTILVSVLFGSVSGFVAGGIYSKPDFWKRIKGEKVLENSSTEKNEEIIKIVKEESAVIDVVEKVSPAVVSIIVSKDLPIIERYYSNPSEGDSFGGLFDDFFNFSIPQYRQKGTEKKEVGGGTGFIVSSDGYVVTNKHVVSDEEAEYTVLMNDETKYEAEVLARDPLTDLAVLKIKFSDGEKNDLTFVTFGDSSNLKPGQSVIAIGNALGEFRNTISTGVISGLARSVTAGGATFGSEQLLGVIQTDASINPGNSGGPLLDLSGKVIGINTAMAAGAENIGFAIPVNEVKDTIESVKENGRIVRPWLGVRYVMLNKEIAKQNNLDINEGALIVRGEQRTDLAVMPGSPADKAGLVENDIILEIDKEKITSESSLAAIIGKHKPGEEINLKIMHKGEEKEVKVKLEEMK